MFAGFGCCASILSVKLFQVFSEAHPNEGIKEWVEAAVHVCHTLHDLRGDVKTLGLGAVCDGGVCCLCRLHHQQAIVWQLRDDKHSHNCQDDTQSFVLLKVLGLEQCSNDDRVAIDHDEEWNAEAHADLKSQDQDLGMVVFIVPVDHGAKMIALKVHFGSSKDKLRDGQYDGQDPDKHAHHFAAGQTQLLGVLCLGALHN